MAIFYEDHPLKHFEKENLTQILLVTDEEVGKNYLLPIQDFFQFKGLKVVPVTIFSHEAGKSLLQAEALYQVLRKENFGKNDGIIALGGGIVQDIAGFVAASYLGGLSFYQIPTSFYSQLTSPFKQEVALHLENFPNTVALKISSQASFLDPFFLESLSKAGEKNAVGILLLLFGSFSEDSFNELQKFSSLEDLWENKEALFLKAHVLMKELSSQQLAFLQTFEALTYIFFGLNPENFSYGEAISLTLQKVLAETEKRGFTEKGTTATLKDVLKKFGLPQTIEEVFHLQEKDVQFSEDQLPYWKKIGEHQLLSENKERLAHWFL